MGLAVAFGLVALYLYLGGNLTIGAPRSWYFAYVAVLLALTFVLVPWPRLATILLSLAAIEAGLGIGSLLLYKYHLIASETLSPRDKHEVRFEWHPILQVVPVPTSAEEAKRTVMINSEKLRGKERSADALRSKIVVALFGGSTTFDMKPDGLSWPDRLEDILGDRYAIINHGMGGYTTAEHVIQTAFYERTAGVSPRCSVYYVGWNDLRNAHLSNLDPGYADFHLPSQVDGFRARRTNSSASIVSPLAALLGRFAGLAFDTVRLPIQVNGKTSGEPDPAFEAIFARNIGAISAINRQRGIRTIWVGQLMNRAKLTAETSYGWLPFVRDSDVYPLIVRLNDIVKREAQVSGDVYVDIPLDKFGDADFPDQGHFTPAGSLKFATLLAPTVAEACR